MAVDYEGKTPVYQQIAAILRDRIESGAMPPGRACRPRLS
jgi:GntR family transcriptional regulator